MPRGQLREWITRTLDEASRRRQSRIRDLEEQVSRLQRDNDRIRPAMRRCLTCEYRPRSSPSVATRSEPMVEVHAGPVRPLGWALVLAVAVLVLGACDSGDGGFEEEYDYVDPAVDDIYYENPPPEFEQGYVDDEIDAAYEEAYAEACAEVLDDGPLYFDGQPYEESDCLDGLGEPDGGGYVDPDDAADPAYDEPVGEPSG